MLEGQSGLIDMRTYQRLGMPDTVCSQKEVPLVLLDESIGLKSSSDWQNQRHKTWLTIGCKRMSWKRSRHLSQAPAMTVSLNSSSLARNCNRLCRAFLAELSQR